MNHENYVARPHRQSSEVGMASHAEYKPLLCENPGQTFLETFIQVERPWSPLRKQAPAEISYQVYLEFPLATTEYLQNSDRFFFLFPKHPDALVNLHFPRGGIYFRDSVMIGIEIKQTRKDLCRDKKLFSYVSSFDYSFLAVTPDLIQAALRKVENCPEFGVFDVTSGNIWKMPVRYPLDQDRRLHNLQTCFSFYWSQPETIRILLPEAHLCLGAPPTEESPDDYRHMYYRVCQEIRYGAEQLMLLLDGAPVEERLAAYNSFMREAEQQMSFCLSSSLQ